MKANQRVRSHKDDRGIEGLPMHLVIIVVVAMAGVGFLLTLLPDGEPQINVHVEGACADGEGCDTAAIEADEGTHTLEVRLWAEADGGRLNDFTVTLSGVGDGMAQECSLESAPGPDNTCDVTGYEVYVPSSQDQMELTVTVQKDGYRDGTATVLIV